MWHTRLPLCVKGLVTSKLVLRFMLALCLRGLASLHLFLHALQIKSAVLCSCVDIRNNDTWNVNKVAQLWCIPYFCSHAHTCPRIHVTTCKWNEQIVAGRSAGSLALFNPKTKYNCQFCFAKSVRSGFHSDEHFMI